MMHTKEAHSNFQQVELEVEQLWLVRLSLETVKFLSWHLHPSSQCLTEQIPSLASPQGCPEWCEGHSNCRLIRKFQQVHQVVQPSSMSSRWSACGQLEKPSLPLAVGGVPGVAAADLPTVLVLARSIERAMPGCSGSHWRIMRACSWHCPQTPWRTALCFLLLPASRHHDLKAPLTHSARAIQGGGRTAKTLV